MKDSKQLDEPRVELVPLLLFMAATAWVGSFIILALRDEDLFLLATIIGAIYTGAGVIAFLHFTRSHRRELADEDASNKCRVTDEVKIDVTSTIRDPSTFDSATNTPSISTFWFIDIRATRGDKGLAALYSHWYRSYGIPMDSLGIDFSVVDYLAIISETNGGRVELISGQFDLNEVRNKLRTLAVASVNCSGMELWVNRENTWMMALLNGFIIFGDAAGVKRCTGTIQGPEISLYGDTNFKDVAQKLASGLMMRLETGTYDRKQYAGLLVAGWSAEKKDADTLAFTNILKFANVSAASDARTAAFVGATQDGQFLRLIVDQGIEDWIKQNKGSK